MTAPKLAEGQPVPTTRLRGAPAIDRLMHKTMQRADGCWEWMGARNPKGYGNIRVDPYGPAKSVHRVSYQHFVGEVPAGLELDHTCANRACVNPLHLEPVTHAENVNRGRHNQYHGITHCKHGHEFNDANTHITKRGRRSCRACARASTRRHRARQEITA